MELDEQIIKDICILNGEEARQCLGKNPFYCRLLLKTSSCWEGSFSPFRIIIIKCSKRRLQLVFDCQMVHQKQSGLKLVH